MIDTFNMNSFYINPPCYRRFSYLKTTTILMFKIIIFNIFFCDFELFIPYHFHIMTPYFFQIDHKNLLLKILYI